MDKGLFSYFRGKKENKRTKFDISYENISSARLFELQTKGLIEVMPDDTHEIGQNTQTKVMPMNSPCMTRIKQNTYAMFNSNQAVWSHWNDFITNGTAFGDTYGNNLSNQELNNPWRVPQIFVNDLQLITKIANGWAIPIFKLPSTLVEKLRSKIPQLDKTKHFKFCKGDTFQRPSFFKAQLSSFYQTIFLMAIEDRRLEGYSDFSDLFEFIPYIVPHFKELTNESDGWQLDGLEIGCDPITACRFYNFLLGTTSDFSLISQEEDYNAVFLHTLGFRFFCDPYSTDLRIKHGPFLLEKYSVNNDFSSYRYKRNIYESVELGDTTDWKYSKVYSYGTFWQSTECDFDFSNLSQGQVFECYKTGVLFGVNSTYHVYNNIPPVFGFLADPYEFLDGKNVYGSNKFNPYESCVGINKSFGTSVMPSPYNEACQDSVIGCPVSSFRPEYIYQEYDVPQPACDILLPLLYTQLLNVGFVGFELPTQYRPTAYTYSLGFDGFGLLIYQCKSASRHLDNCDIPLEGITCRNSFDYRFETILALPFFHYSKCWNDVFRNKTVSSAELDYRQTNSVLQLDYNRINYFKAYPATETESCPEWLQNAIDDNAANSWVIPFDYLPKNPYDDVLINDSPIFYKLIKNECHYFNIVNMQSAFALLTGYALQEVVCYNVLNVLSNQFSLAEQAPSAKQMIGILLDKFYLPNYYNGLLHTKYQNFPKDYFSSALLDPQSGANVVDIPDNIVELRNATALQKFWEGLAVARSIRSYFQQKFGTSPSHGDDTNTLLLGQNHSPVNIGEVIQTSQTDNTPQGTRSGLGAAHSNSGLCSKRFNEHGFIVIVMSHTLELQYQQGLQAKWQPKDSFLDYPVSDFAHVGNESIKQKEIFYESKSLPNNVLANLVTDVNGVRTKLKFDGHTLPALKIGKNMGTVTLIRNKCSGSEQGFNTIFGYIPRWSVYKFAFDTVHGDMRDIWDFWHTFRKFFAAPILCHELVNGEFIAENDEFNRIFASTSEENGDYFIVNMFVNASVKRAMPYVCAPAGN